MANFIECLLENDDAATKKATSLYDTACERLGERHQGKGAQLGGDDIVPEICVLLDADLMRMDLLDTQIYQDLQKKSEAWSVSDPIDMAKCAPVQMALVSHMDECRSKQQLHKLQDTCRVFLDALNIVITSEMFDVMERNNFEENYEGSDLLDKAMAQQDLVGSMLTMILQSEQTPAQRVQMFQALYKERHKDIAIRQDPETRQFIDRLDELLGSSVEKKTMIATMWEKTKDKSTELAKKANEIIQKKTLKP